MRGVCSEPGCGLPHSAKGLCKSHYSRAYTVARTGGTRTRPGEPSRFLDAIPEAGVGCITWPFARQHDGYPRFCCRIDGKKHHHTASREICIRRHGPPPSDTHQAAHSCGNGHLGCVAPWHLSWKTPAENTADSIALGTFPKGAKNGRAILTLADVAAIRGAHPGNSIVSIARSYGVGASTISRVVNHQSWRAA